MNAPGEASDIHDVTPAPMEDALPTQPVSELDVESPPHKPESEVSNTAPRIIPRHRLIYRTSLPVVDIACEEAKEEELEHEYELKSQCVSLFALTISSIT